MASSVDPAEEEEEEEESLSSSSKGFFRFLLCRFLNSEQNQNVDLRNDNSAGTNRGFAGDLRFLPALASPFARPFPWITVLRQLCNNWSKNKPLHWANVQSSQSALAKMSIPLADTPAL